MGRINAVLEEEVEYGFEGGPAYSTDVTDLENGFEERDSEWRFPKHEYSASFKDIDDSSRDYIISAFHACRGRRHSFKFKDWNDYTVVEQPLQVLPGTSDPIQLYKLYAPFGEPYVATRPIQAWKWAEIVDPNDDVVAGSLDFETGIFTPVGAWGPGPYRLNGEFYVWVRFDADYNAMTINSWKAHTARVNLVEDRFAFSPTNVPPSWEE